MEIINDSLVYSATDLVGFLECGHLTSLERATVSGHLEGPVRSDPVLDRIAQRGQLHEERFLDSLLSEGFRVVKLEPDRGLPRGQRLVKGRDETLEAMRAGADVVYQAVLFDGRRLGFADFLRRVEQGSDLFPWSYEVWDTKLARYAKASAVLQLCMYSDFASGITREWRLRRCTSPSPGRARRDRFLFASPTMPPITGWWPASSKP